MDQIVLSRPEERAPVSAASLARRLGVSSAAVSYALNGRPGVSENLRRRILDEARAAGVPVAVDAQEKQGTLVFGLILADISNPFYAELATSVTDVGRARGIEVFLTSVRDHPESAEGAVRALIRHDVDGVIITSLDADNAAVCRPLRAAGIPFVLVSRRLANMEADFVGINDYAAGRDIMAHVLADGHDRIAIIAGRRSSTASRQRLAGFLAQMRSGGVQPRHEWIISGGLNEDNGARATEYLLDLGDLPDAIVCGTDAIAFGVISTLASHGVRVPEDVAVTGFDGLSAARSPMLDLTTIVQPRQEMAVNALRLLSLRQGGGGGAPQAITCTHQLHVGTSCGRHQKGRTNE